MYSPHQSPVPVALHQPVDEAPLNRGFLALIKHWMGRIISLGLQAPVHLYRLLFKVQTVATPLISPHHTPESSPAPLKKGQITPEASSPGKKIPFPIQQKEGINKEEVDEEIFDEEDESLPILEGFFKNMGLDTNFKEVLTTGFIFDLKGNPIKYEDLTKLSGSYQVEWNIQDETSEENDFILIYKGKLEKGVFHGEGEFFRLNNDGSSDSLLDGTFEHGAFTSGMMVIDDSYIQGTFNKGYRNGKGIIHYFKTEIQESASHRMEYHGEFTNGIPHGKGKILSILNEIDESKASNSGYVKVLAQGEFKNGQITKGQIQEENGRTFTGEWAEDTFKGKIRDSKHQWSFEGTFFDGAFQGQGVLEATHHYRYDNLELSFDETTKEQEMLLVPNKKGIVNTVFKGEFKNGDMCNGERIITWPFDDKKGIETYKDGEVITTEVSTPTGHKFVGTFAQFTLDGQGKIFDAHNHELYSGSIKCGYPHGKGRLQQNHETKEGNFEWGNFVELPSETSTPELKKEGLTSEIESV